ncbi:hypothetical protein BSLG_010584 [Batrachochytrium salamandrivorans]|nr:hypothetical protein BSLG_010584 [Batrachochytrium salamandrivorans]
MLYTGFHTKCRLTNIMDTFGTSSHIPFCKLSLATTCTVNLDACHGKNEDFLAGAEDGCCGLAAVILSLGHYDKDVLAKSKTLSAKWRRASRFITATIQIAIIVAAASAVRIVTNPSSRPEQKSSVFVLLPCLLLSITSWIENMYDGILVLYGD